MSTIWITGAHGFIGRHAALALSRAGHAVGGVGHGLWPSAASWGVRHWLNGDVNASNLGALAAQGKPDAVLHLAGGSSVGAAIAQPREDFRRTVESTAELLEWLRQEAPECRLLAVSSAAVYGDGHSSPIAEHSVLNPYSPYGHHKAIMESLCRSYAAGFGLRVVVARLFSVYGAGLRKQLLWDLCSKLATGGRIELGGSGAERRDWVHVEDVAVALSRLLPQASAAVPVFNVATGRGVSVREIANLVASSWQTPGAMAQALTFSGRGRPGDPQYLVADTSRTAALGWAPHRNLAESLAEYVAWFRKEGVS